MANGLDTSQAELQQMPEGRGGIMREIASLRAWFAGASLLFALGCGDGDKNTLVDAGKTDTTLPDEGVKKDGQSNDVLAPKPDKDVPDKGKPDLIVPPPMPTDVKMTCGSKGCGTGLPMDVTFKSVTGADHVLWLKAAPANPDPGICENKASPTTCTPSKTSSGYSLTSYVRACLAGACKPLKSCIANDIVCSQPAYSNVITID